MAKFLIGGITRADVVRDAGLTWEPDDPVGVLLPPLPNFLFSVTPRATAGPSWLRTGQRD